MTLLHTPGTENDSDWGSKLLLSENVALRPCYWTSRWLFLPQDDWPTTKYQFSPDDAIELMQPKLLVSSMHMGNEHG